MTQPPTPSADCAARLVRHLATTDREAAVLLTAHPGPYWTPDLAAALWDLPLPEAQHRLDRLVQLDLLTCHGDGCHTMAIEVRAALDLVSQKEVPVVCGQVHESLAWLAHKRGDLDQARNHFEQAWGSYTPVDRERALQALSASREFTRPTT